LRYQVLLMLDPLEQKVGLYILDESDRLVNIGFNMIEAVEQERSNDGNHRPEST